MIQTNWHVITGPPSSGKTTLINQLTRLGFCTSPEIAREYIEGLLAKNFTIESIRHDAEKMQRNILALILKRERHLSAEQLIFFDRGSADSLGYFKYYHLNADHVVRVCQHTRYKKIFYCHPLPMIQDAVRTEDELMAQKIGECIYEAYAELNYKIIELPAVSVTKRLQLMLQHIE